MINTARELGIKGLTVAALIGDDVSDKIPADTVLFDYGGRRLSEVGRPFVGTNAYLGIDSLVPAVQTGADVVITGRVADPSLYLAPLVDHFSWASDDWPRLGKGSLVGHLMECGMQITGGYFADPGYKEVPHPRRYRLSHCRSPRHWRCADYQARRYRRCGKHRDSERTDVL